MALGTIGGAEVGAQLIQMLKRQGNVDFVVSIVSIVDLFQHLFFHGLGELEDRPAAKEKGRAKPRKDVTPRTSRRLLA